MRCLNGLSILVLWAGSSHGKDPVVLDNRLVLELAASAPDIVTPTGLTVDERGRVWVIENHTHQRQGHYKGPTHDRIRIFSDPDEHGKFRKFSTFADGFKNAMSLALGKEGAVYLATRSDIWLLRDTNGKGEANDRTAIVKLDSKGDYPHNGLSGLAWDPLGNLYFALGENLGASYKLIGSDGTTFAGGGEGGSIYRCRPDGKKLERVATGFWNTFALTFDAFGNLFAVDNDPDARGPCRLLHVVEGGDYGYRFRNGRKGLHPFTSWNGELPGTLPMVAGTAEAPSGILAYESNGLPSEYRGQLFVTSWGDHVIERFTPSSRGASFSATSSVLVRGGEDFRPVAIAAAPDGSIYFSDWVDKSYPVHGKGRIWHLRMKELNKDDGLRPSAAANRSAKELGALLSDPRIEIRLSAATALAGKGDEGHGILIAALKENKDVRTRLASLWGMAHESKAPADMLAALNDPAPEVRGPAVSLVGRLLPNSETKAEKTAAALSDPASEVRLQAILQHRHGSNFKSIIPVLADADPFLVGAAIEALAQPGNLKLLASALVSDNPKIRLGVLLALRRIKDVDAQTYLPQFLKDSSPAVRRAAVQWVAEEHLTQFKDAIAASAATPPVTRELFEALLAAREMLQSSSSQPKAEPSGEEYVSRIVKDPGQPSVFRTFGMRMLPPQHPVFTIALLKGLLADADANLRAETVRTLALRYDPLAQGLLQNLAQDRKLDIDSRALAVLGMAPFAAESAEIRKLLLGLLYEPKLQRDALRSLRGVDLSAAEKALMLKWWSDLPAQENLSAERRELAEQLLMVLASKPHNDDAELRQALEKSIGPGPTNEAEWSKALSKKGDPAAGERAFFHQRGARCAVCHRVEGRGAQIGPELSMIGTAQNRSKLIESILYPSKEIAPAFTAWSFHMSDGKEYAGVVLSENFDSTLTIADAEGKKTILKRLDIEERRASPKSLMPDDLHRVMTRQEFLDLLEYLSARSITSSRAAERR